MSNSLYLQIADLNIKIDSGDVPMLPIENPNYKQFIKQADEVDQNKVDLNWHVSEKDFTVHEDLQEIATFPENVWSLYRNAAEERFIIPKYQETVFPRWALRFTQDFQNIKIYGNETTVSIENGEKKFSEFFLRPVDHIFLIHYLLKNKGLVMHCAGVDIDGKGYIFTGVSGKGKSTIAKLFIENGITTWLSDERVILKENQQGELFMYGTPWPSSAELVSNTGVPLAGVFFIANGDAPVIRPLERQQAMANLFAVTAIPWYDSEFMEGGCAVLNTLVNTIPMYEFSYKPEISAVSAWQEFIAKK